MHASVPRPHPDAHYGQRIYSREVLALYDVAVLGLSNPWLWRCPTAHIAALYDRWTGARHLEVGVGTGYYLDRCHFPVPNPHITLLDLNVTALDAAAGRIARYRPTTVQADLLAPLPADLGAFDSIACTYVLHCLPGDLATKGSAVARLAAHLRPGGVLFGATLLRTEPSAPLAARGLAALYNRLRIFDNRRDTEAGLREVLTRPFEDVELRRHGSAALFVLRRPRLAATAQTVA
jgi:SAM-dependent methyltransferase